MPSTINQAQSQHIKHCPCIFFYLYINYVLSIYSLSAVEANSLPGVSAVSTIMESMNVTCPVDNC